LAAAAAGWFRQQPGDLSTSVTPSAFSRRFGRRGEAGHVDLEARRAQLALPRPISLRLFSKA
jgi:hypothetical protein